MPGSRDAPAVGESCLHRRRFRQKGRLATLETADRSGADGPTDPAALPFDRSRSQEISQVVGPLLRSEALAAQSASIDVVSGATYTSNGYAQSLQSALDRAHA
jgi:hypothetical protein